MAMQAVLLNQYRLFHDRPAGGRGAVGVPVGGGGGEVSLTPVRLRPDEWKSGDRCRLVDLIAPGATVENNLAALMLEDLRGTALKGQPFFFHKAKLALGRREVVEVGVML